MKKEEYQNPLCTRYASDEMKQIFSDDFKFSTWRRLWVALAEAEQTLGLPITDEQLAELRAHITDIDYERADAYEHDLRHDVMAHVHAYADQCPHAGAVIHLGATSCYVGDNTDMIVMRHGLLRVRKLLINVLAALSDFAEKNREIPTLAYTHFQAAQPTTVGKRATLWAQDLLMDLDALDYANSRLRLLGCKGTTGTGASFLSLFGGDADKVCRLEALIAEKVGFEGCVAVSGQTYTRKFDYTVLSVLSAIAQSCSKFAGDFRLLSHLKEVDEPFTDKQIGSSAMAYKRNPMRSERIASLARFVITDAMNPAITAATQWLERTLDDSANRRISIPQAFLAVDGMLNLYLNIIRGCSVYPGMCRRHLNEELPYLATENILMESVKRGGDRQVLHEAIRELSVAVTKRIKLEGGDNDLLERIAQDPRFPLTQGELADIVHVSNFIGLAPAQTTKFLQDYIAPVLAANADALGADAEVRV